MKHSRPSQPGGRLMGARRTITICEGELAIALMPRCIVTLNANKEERRAFRHYCVRNAIVAIPIQWLRPDCKKDDEWQGSPFVFDCSGEPNDLLSLEACPQLVSIENAIAVRVGQIATGTGDEKIRSSPPRPKPNLRSNADPGRFDPSTPHRI